MKQIPGVRILQYSASLYYANIENFLSMLSLQSKCDVTAGENHGNQNGAATGSAISGITNAASCFDLVDSDKQSYNMKQCEIRNGSTSKFVDVSKPSSKF